MTTLDDIAKALGLTKGTVSKALNGAMDVSESTRREVLEKAIELGYCRRKMSKSFARIAVFVPDHSYEVPGNCGYDVILGFRKAAEPAKYEVHIVDLHSIDQKLTRYDSYMLEKKFCGGLFIGISSSDFWLSDFKNCITPTVLYDTHVGGNPHVSHVGPDNDEAMMCAVDYMLSLGHKKLGYLSINLDSYMAKQRFHSYMHALQNHHLEPDAHLTGTADSVDECISLHLPRLLNEGCSGIICSNDILAASVLMYCDRSGIVVPQDVSILGFDDIPLCLHTQPPLTTLKHDRGYLGQSAFYAFSSLINKVPISTLLLHSQLIERSSCAPYFSAVSK